MTDNEVREALLSICNIMRDHLKATIQLEEVAQALIERNPELKGRFEIAQSAEHEESAHSDAPPLLQTTDLLLRVQQVIQGLTPRNFRKQT